MRIATTRSSPVCQSSSLHHSLKRLPSDCSIFALPLTNCNPLLLLSLLLNSWTLHTLRLLGRTSFQVRAALTGGEAWVTPNLQDVLLTNRKYNLMANQDLPCLIGVPVCLGLSIPLQNEISIVELVLTGSPHSRIHAARQEGVRPLPVESNCRTIRFLQRADQQAKPVAPMD